MDLLACVEKNYTIISENDILLNALVDNTDCKFQGSLEKDFKDKIDILIIDSTSINPKSLPLFRANIIINLTNEKIVAREINLAKPLYLKTLIEIIIKNSKDNSLFCAINDNWVYHERSSALISNDQEISLTDKENDLFKALLQSDGFATNKDLLRSTVWKHHRDTESTTIETHIYKLKQKLPAGLLEIKNSTYRLVL
jgi:DNA-binding response OmpR family regulator